MWKKRTVRTVFIISTFLMLISGAFGSGIKEYESNLITLEAERSGDWVSVISDGSDPIVLVQIRNEHPDTRTSSRKTSIQRFDSFASGNSLLECANNAFKKFFFITSFIVSYPNKYIDSIIQLLSLQ